MKTLISARITEKAYHELVEQVASGRFASLSQAIAHYIQLGLQAESGSNLESTLRRLLREELGRVGRTEQQPDQHNPKLARMLRKGQR